MENTCNYEECKLFELLGGNPEQCPNYQESWWQPDGNGQPVLVKDCSPRRTLLMIQSLYARLEGVQKVQEQQRNENVWVQVVAEVLGKNSGIDLEAFVQRRKELQIAELITAKG